MSRVSQLIFRCMSVKSSNTQYGNNNISQPCAAITPSLLKDVSKTSRPNSVFQGDRGNGILGGSGNPRAEKRALTQRGHDGSLKHFPFLAV